MSVDTPQLKLDPYQSQVPMLNLPQQDLQPGGPLPHEAGFMGKTGSVASVLDQGVKGFLRGRQAAEQKKAQQANYAIDLSQKNEQNAWSTYQDALRTGQAKPGDEKDPAYQAYIQAHHTTSQTMEKVAIPEDKPKGQKGAKKKDDDNKPKSFGEKLSAFMSTNPHVIPQALIAARVPNKPVMTAQTEEQKNTLASQGKELTLQDQQIDANKVKQAQAVQQQKDQEALRQVDAAGGIDKVASDPNAPPELQMVARREVSQRLDKEGPDGQLRDKYAKDILTGASKNWTPADHQMAANLGYAAQPKEVKITGKNGHEQMVLVDPNTNQPIAGSKPMDLGTPQWAQEFYAERAAKKADVRKAVEENPEQFGVTLSGDKETDKARIQAAADRVTVDHEQGIKSAAGALGRTGFEVQRNDAFLSAAAKEINSKIGSKAGAKTLFDWPGEKNGVALSREDASRIMDQFITLPTGDHPGIYTFRDKAQLQTGKDAGAAERDRKWVHDLVLDKMMTGKGKSTMTREQAENILKETALGQPITPDQVVSPPEGTKKKGAFSRFWDDGPFGSSDKVEGKSGKSAFGPPPTESGATPGGKYYAVPGVDGPVQLSDEDVAKAKANNIQLEEVSPELLKQFGQ